MVAVRLLCDPNFCQDTAFESFPRAIRIMFEGMIDGDGYFGCFHNSSHTFMGPLYAYMFIFVTTIMLVSEPG